MYSRDKNDITVSGKGKGIGTGTDTETGTGTCTLMWVLLWAIAVIVVQQWYARTHHYGIEQPIGLLGLAEYLFRHPEKLIRLFKY